MSTRHPFFSPSLRSMRISPLPARSSTARDNPRALNALTTVAATLMLATVLSLVPRVGHAADASGDAPIATQSPVGVWKTIDDSTHKPKALIEIESDDNGVLSGKILTGLGASHSPGSRCTACVDDRKNQPMQGLTIIRDMKRNGNQWEGGNILDPENGKTYHCRMHVSADGKELIVRGYLGVPLIGRSQTWIREPDIAAARAATHTGSLDH